MPFIDNNASSLLFRNKRDHIVKSTLICGTALASIMVANPLTKTTVKADTAPATQISVPATQINTPTTDWVATKPADIHVDNNQKTYTLNRGDTLWAIAQATNTDVNQLAQLNNINLEAGDQYHLAVGLTIKLTADAQTENNNSSDNANTTVQNNANSDNSDNAESTAANNSSTAETPKTATNNNAAQTTNHAENSPQSGSADTTATGNQAANENSNASDASNTGGNTNADTTKNGQVDTSKSQVSKPADVIHNESGTNTSDKPSSQSTVSQSGALSDGSTNSQASKSSIDKTSSSKPATNSSPSSSADNTSNNNNNHAASSSTKGTASTPASSSSKPNSSSASNAGSGPINNNHGATHSSSSSSPNASSSSSSSKDNDSSNSPSSSSSDNNPNNTSNTSDYKQTAPLNNNDLAKVVALEKQINDLKIQADTVDNNLQFYQDFIDATKHAHGTNPQDRLEKIAFQNSYYQKNVGYIDMHDEQAQLTAIKAQLPIDNQMITNLQNQLAKPDITNAKKQTLTTDLNNAKATAIKDQETYQTLQAKIDQNGKIVAKYKAYLARNADMTAALKGNGQANILVAQYQKYINDNQKTEASLNAQITNTRNQLKTYGVTLTVDPF